MKPDSINHEKLESRDSAKELLGLNSVLEKLKWRAKILAQMAVLITQLAIPSHVTAGQQRIEEATFEPKTKADKIAREFPRSIPGFKPIEVHAVQNSKQTLILFPQIHYDAISLDNVTNPAERYNHLKDVTESQRKIYGVLMDKKEKFPSKKICLESISHRDEITDFSRYKENPRFILYDMADILALYIPNSDLPEAVNKKNSVLNNSLSAPTRADLILLENNIDPILRRYYEDYRFIVGAGLLAFSEGKINLCPAEDPRIFNANFVKRVATIAKKSIDEETSEDKAFMEEVVLEQRENAAIKKVADAGGDAVGLQFGREHDFRKNVKDWNDTHPKHQISLIIAEPQLDPGQLETLPEAARLSTKQLLTANYIFKLQPWKTIKMPPNQIETGIEILKNNTGLGFTESQLQTIRVSLTP